MGNSSIKVISRRCNSNLVQARPTRRLLPSRHLARLNLSFKVACQLVWSKVPLSNSSPKVRVCLRVNLTLVRIIPRHPPPQQSMMQGPPTQGQQPGGPIQSFAEGPRRFISPENSQDIAQGDASSRVSSMSPQNEGGLGKPNLQHIATTLDASREQGQGQQQQPNPHIQHPGSPQNYPLPDSAATFSPVNPAAGRLPNPPAPMAGSVHDSEPATDKGNISDISHTPSPRSGVNGPGVAMTHNIPLADEQNRSSSLSPDPSRGPHHQVSNPALNINVGKANSQSSDTEDIYDATPRKMRSPSGQMHEPERLSDNKNNNAGVVGAAAAGGVIIGGTALGITAGATTPDDMAPNGGGGYFVQPPNGGNYDPSVGGTPSVAAESVTPYDRPGAQQQQQQQPAIHAEPEEKILVDQPVELAAAPDDLDDGMPVMSATSYPGQEWNPYGYGEFGDFEA
ncbi:uncharacterized protein PG998_012139 [Apiospora kogelbergensis]|uniref:uncharacterized protein n=1 Tax=Apiospora kogelbergensis TaxID=1337665 RepID=UPI00312E4819